MPDRNISSTLPAIGKSRWRQIKPLSFCCKATFLKLSREGRAPKPERVSIRCTVYDNVELRRWLADPVNYRAGITE